MSSVYRIALNTGRAPRSGQQCLIPSLRLSPTISNLCSFSSSITEEWETGGLGVGGVLRLANMGNQLAAGEYLPPFEYHPPAAPFNPTCPQLKSMPQTLSPQPVNGKVCVLHRKQKCSIPELAHGGYWLVGLGLHRSHLYCPPTSLLCSSYLSFLPCTIFQSSHLHQMRFGNP